MGGERKACNFTDREAYDVQRERGARSSRSNVARTV